MADCRILRHLTLKSDGHIGCDDSTGYGIVLGQTRATGKWTLREILDGPIYRHIRSSFAEGRVPWPGICEGCDLYSPGGEAHDTLDSRFDLLVEPTLACELSCACCIRKSLLSKGRDTNAMDPEMYRRFIRTTAEEGYLIDEIHYIGWGEPLLHPRFSELVDIAYQAFPHTTQMATSTGNADFMSALGGNRFDHIVLSCDGTTDESYVRYRRGGSFKQAMKFAREAKTHGHPDLRLEWKYILFEFNDSDEEIITAQKMAEDVGVDSLLFIITNSKWHSKRFGAKNTHQFPLVSPVACISPAAAMNSVVTQGAIGEGERGTDWGYIDKVAISSSQFLSVEGWTLAPAGAYARHVELWLDDRKVSQGAANLRRIDVLEAKPGIAGPNCGFRFNVPVSIESLPAEIRVRTVFDQGSTQMGGAVDWRNKDAINRIRKDLVSRSFDPGR